MVGASSDAANDVAEELASKELRALIEEAIAQLFCTVADVPPEQGTTADPNRDRQSPSLSVQTVKNQLYRANDQVKEYIAARIEPSILA